MKLKQVIFLLISVLLFSSCGGDANAEKDPMTQVEEMITSKDYESAQSLCNEIIGNKELKSIPVKNLCKLSLAYIKLSEQINNEENMAKATKCYHTAIILNADSVSNYVSALPVEDLQYAEMLSRLSETINAPREFPEHEEDESCDGDCANCQREVCINN